MSDPTRITREQLRAAYDALGLDPARFADTIVVSADEDTVKVARVIYGADGHYAGQHGIRIPVDRTHREGT